MQATPTRLSQAIWTAFQAARPIRHTRLVPQSFHSRCEFSFPQTQRGWPAAQSRFVRSYSDSTKSSDVERKVQDAKDRIQESLEARAKIVGDAGQSSKTSAEETIVHAKPESSSIVYAKNDTQDNKPKDAALPHSSSEKESRLPSQAASLRSQVTNRFSQFMDSLQTQIFVASRRLNDLTGYTGIERLKQEIDTQESYVQSARQLVKSSRDKYAEAIAMRSTTQREVNDLLHRKHAWSPQDLERFTSLYRSDHANEQAEQKAHQTLSDAEVRYEESSTQLAKSILARYHEEQIWSDKIRQMSTWGTWGLMGLNVLLFVVLQLAIEPWRRRRLVRGFEEKVEVALAAREQENQALRAQLNAKAMGSGPEVVTEAVNLQSESAVSAAGEAIAESIVDAITGSTDETTTATTHHQDNTDDKTAIEQAVEQVTAQEIQQEDESAQTIFQATQSTILKEGEEDIIGSPDIVIPPTTEQINLSSWSTSQLLQVPYTWFTKSYNTLLLQFNTTDHIVLSRRDLTTKVLEGVATGIALTGSITYFILVRK